MNRLKTTHKNSNKSTLARIKEEMAAPRMARSAREASAKRRAANALGRRARKKSPRLERAN